MNTFRGGLKLGDGVEPNPGDAGCISQWSDGWACPLCFSTCLSAVTLNDHKGQICASTKNHPTLPPSPPPLPPTTTPTPLWLLTSSSLCRWYNWHSYNDFTATGLYFSAMCANVKVAWIILSITIYPVIRICGRVTIFLFFCEKWKCYQHHPDSPPPHLLTSDPILLCCWNHCLSLVLYKIQPTHNLYPVPK